MHGLWLPALIVGAPLAAACTRMCASQLLGTLHEDFVRTARGKGAAPRRVVWRHALPAAAGPVIALVGVNMNLILTNLALIESVFDIPGGFRYIERALVNRDVDLVQALVVEATLFIVARELPRRRDPRVARSARAHGREGLTARIGVPVRSCDSCTELEQRASWRRSQPHWPPRRPLQPPACCRLP